MLFLYVLAGLLGAAAMVFVLQNPDPVAVGFLNWQSGSMPLSLLLLLALFAGMLVAWASGLAHQIALKRRIRYLERRITELTVPLERPAHVEPPPRPEPAMRKA